MLDLRMSQGPELQEPRAVPHWLSPQRPGTIWVSIPRRSHLPASGFERFLSRDGDSLRSYRLLYSDSRPLPLHAPPSRSHILQFL